MKHYEAATVGVADAVAALAMTGDLAMGQPPGHSTRVARLAGRVAEAAGAGTRSRETARVVALLRWSGSTASAAGFAALLGDDVGGRHAMLARTLPANHRLTAANALPLARLHCEVAGDIARMLGLPAGEEAGLRHLFEHANGNGLPARLHGDAIPAAVFHVALAGDLEVLARAHGLPTALRVIGRLAGRKYPAHLVQQVSAHARSWLDALDAPDDAVPPAAGGDVPLALVADVMELKLPWLAGHARRVAAVARDAAALAGLPPTEQRCLERAALLHGAGRAAIPNPVWNNPGRLRKAEREQVRRAPYWTARMATHVPGLAAEALLAAHAYERLDGSGYFRSVTAEALSPAHRLLAAAAAWTALRSPRPWRAPYQPAAATALLAAQAGRFDRQAVEAVTAAATRHPAMPCAGPLSDREAEVLRWIGSGAGTANAARALRISPGAVRTHVGSILEKLESSSLPAAMLKALALGIFQNVIQPG
ncbi:HD domain-containing phosphohydrolase [Pseudoduganella umbonata]|uniref:HD-GYP domain-containing protein (C-di-GMP phosphodiesterase class II) n=1 Tax=Pseudoduganella umbonata TaxID=864828 RepID=A0A4P8HM80_9BURK|nr:HD domain-containing phosphohydrolase [Pseudoduganella umbonata]MBB3219355.1 HD-GYP domain-containing protein (c-di-GMP phosphodiesterase class II) [Pseudoduganella umbonata]QCP09452.1 phosphohydrolase [Pseudoduganella umbonata]